MIRVLVAGAMVALAAAPVVADRSDAEYWVNAGNRDYFDRDFDDAETDYTRAINADDTWALAYNNRGLARFRQGDFSGAEADFEEAKSRNGLYVAPYINKGKCLAAQESFAAAATELEAGLAIDGDNEKLLYNLGWVLAAQGRYDQAIARYNEAISFRPDYVRAMIARGVAQAGKGATEAAVASFYQAINAAGSDDLLSAIAAYDLQVLRGSGLDFEDADAAAALEEGIFLMGASLYEDAISALEEADDLEQGLPQVQWLLSWSNLYLKHTGDASDWLETAQASMPELVVESPRAGELFVDGIARGNAEESTRVFPGRIDVTVRGDEDGQRRERRVVAYTDGTAGGESPIRVIASAVSAYSLFAAPADVDQDWLGDDWENTWFGGLAAIPQEDVDNDGASNLREYWANSDPLSEDSDLDQLPDGWEIDNGTDPLSAAGDDGADGDPDGDGLGNALELANGTDPRDPDCDGDGMFDGWEVRFNLDPLDGAGDNGPFADVDSDGLHNYDEWAVDSDPLSAASPPVLLVDAMAGDDAGDGSAAGPFATVQQAVDAATPPALIRLAAGTYQEHVVLPDRIALVGSDPGTTIDAGGTGRPLTLAAGARAALVNLRLTGGEVDDEPEGDPSGDGGGLLAYDGAVLSMRGVVVEGNTLDRLGAGGAGAYFEEATVRIDGCVFRDNHNLDSGRGGAIYASDSQLLMVNTLVADNQATEFTLFDTIDGIAIQGGSASIVSSTIVGHAHRAVDVGSANLAISNSILWHNGDSIALSWHGQVTLAYTCAQEYMSGPGVIRADPMFGPDYRLREGSPCIDAADASSAPRRDFFGRLRWDDPEVENTGIGNPATADMGYHERSGSWGELVYLVPAAAHGEGNEGTSWVTDVVLHNPYGAAAEVGVYFLKAWRENTNAVRHRVTVQPCQSRRIEDVVEDLFGHSEASGAILVGSDVPLLISSRTYNDAATGTYGQYIQAYPELQALRGPGPGRLIQLTETPRFRTNVGFVNVTGEPLTLWVDVYEAAGGHLGRLVYTLQPFGYHQKANLVAELTSDAVDDAYAVIGSPDENARYLVYASAVDNQSGDPVCLVPQIGYRGTQYIPASARAPGENETMWRTDVEVANPTGFSATYRIDLLRSNRDNSDPLSRTFTLAAGASERFGDVLGLFGLSGKAALRIVPLSGVVMATSRTYNDLVEETYGQFIPAENEASAIGVGESGRLVQLAHSPDLDSGFRTNIGLVNTSANAIVVEVDLFAGDGTPLGSESIGLQPFAYHQEGNVFDEFTDAPLDDAYARVWSISDGARFLAYASVVDNRSGDPVYIPAQRVANRVDALDLVECAPPAILGVEVSGITPGGAVVTFATDKGARGQVHVGLSCGQATSTFRGEADRTSHEVHLGGLAAGTTYRFSVEATDEAGNSRVDDNEGTCYQFTTTAVQVRTVTLPGGVSMELVRIPAGTFMMGSDTGERGRSGDEGPRHQVTLSSSFWMGRTEVTQAQWQALMGDNPSSGHGVGSSYPVYYVSWNDIAGSGGFLERLNDHLASTGQTAAGQFRLPTEAEWEYAARAGTSTRFSFGDILECDDECGDCDLADLYMWWCGNKMLDRAWMVGSKYMNAFGLFDMHGNVIEWVNDWWDRRYEEGDQVDPTGPSSGTFRATRGGCWNNDAQHCRSASRGEARPDSTFYAGFRVVAAPAAGKRAGR